MTLPIAAGETIGNLHFSLQEGGRFSGSVADSQGQDLTGICIHLLDPATHAWLGGSETDASGAFSVAASPGDYRLQADPDCHGQNPAGYLAEYWDGVDGAFDAAQATTLTLAQSATVDAVDFVLQAGVALSGSLVNDLGQPIADACVGALPPTGWDWVTGTGSDQNGDFTLRVPPGNYHVMVDYTCGGGQTPLYPQFIFWDGEHGFFGHWEQALLVDATGEDVTGLDFVIPRNAIVNGSVSGRGGGPLAGICVNGWGASGGYFEATTDQSGQFSAYAPPGVYQTISTNIDCSPQADLPYVKEYWDGSDGSPSPIQRVDLNVSAPGATVGGVDFILEPAAFVTGQIINEAGQPLSGVCVSASSPQLEAGDSGNTDAAGHYRLAVPASAYEIRANPSCMGNTAPWYAPEYWTGDGGTPYREQATQLAVNTGETLGDVDFILGAGGALTGRVTDPQGTPLAGVPVQLQLMGGPGGCGRTVGSGASDENGDYLLGHVLSGVPMALSARAGQIPALTPYADGWWNGNDHPVSPNCETVQPLTIAAAESRSGINMQLQRGGVFEGRVTDADGQPLAGVCVRAKVPHVEQGIFGQTERNGDYALTVAAGTYVIRALPLCTGQGSPWYASDFWAPNGGVDLVQDAAKLPIAGNESVINLDLALPAGAAVSGVVTDGQGVPAAFAEVEPWLGTNPCDTDSNTRGSVVYTDASGHYRVPHLPANQPVWLRVRPSERYWIPGERKQFANEWWDGTDGSVLCSEAQALTLTADQEQTGVDFQLGAGGIFAGQVTDTDGNPLVGASLEIYDQACDGTLLHTVEVDYAGRFQARGVAAGSTYLKVSAGDSGLGFEDAWWDDVEGTSQCADATAVAVSAGVNSTETDVAIALVMGTPVQNLITHYYNHILDRAPDAGGLAFWDAENTRLRSEAVESKEAFILMAVYFFNSAEYLARNTDNATFLGHLYRTFFNREADQGGLDYWLGQINDGMPRDIVMLNFLFSPEFSNFMDGYLEDSPSRAEVLAVMDFYRGLLNRIPETEGLNSWVGQFRSAQCLSAEQVAGEVYRQAGDISWAFLNSGEYLGRQRSNAQYVSDLYNAFMRRGGDLEGVTYWIGQLDTAAQNREQLRLAFIDSPEFSGRVQAIVDAGCLP